MERFDERLEELEKGQQGESALVGTLLSNG
jgi:hypothetical protein